MDARSLAYICTACGGEVRHGRPDLSLRHVGTDSRQIKPGDLFFALAGERFDGHEFLTDAAQRGAAGLVVSRVKAERISDLPGRPAVVLVEDPRAALGQLAARYRKDFRLPVIAVGGSNGKTTTKELAASVLRQHYDTLWSEASFNNDIGVPLTLLNLESHHEAAVVEVGSNHPGELEPLLRMTQPRFSMLTSVGREHLEFFGDLAGVAQEEGWLAEVLPREGKFFANGDSNWTDRIAQRTEATVVRVGLGDRNDWRADQVRFDSNGVTFRVAAPRRKFSGEYRVALLGRHQVSNALLSLAAGAELGLGPEEARRGLAAFQPPKMRMQLWEVGGVRVLDDSYNANADSMLAALRTLGELACHGRRVAVLGEMAELGAHTAEAHREIGQAAADVGVALLLAVGQPARRTAESARSAGLKDVVECATVAEAAEVLVERLERDDLVLLKASRSVGLERVGQVLRERLARPDRGRTA